MRKWKVKVDTRHQCIHVGEHASVTLGKSNRQKKDRMNSREI